MLPLEILREIALKNPWCYIVMNQTCKQLHLDWDMVMKHFTKLDGIRYRLPDIPNHRYFTGNDHIIDDETHSCSNRWYSMWCYNGKCHRENDLPALVYTSGAQEWYRHGKLHRDNDLPAIIAANGTQRWYNNGNLHRGNGLPSIVYGNGLMEWYHHGMKITEEVAQRLI